MEDDWGLGDGDDMDRMEKEELEKETFLMAGNTDCMAGRSERQTTIKIWSEAELICREIALESCNQSNVIGKFMSDLGEQLRARISSKRSEPCLEDGSMQKNLACEPAPAHNIVSTTVGRPVASESGTAHGVASKHEPDNNIQAVVSLMVKEEKVCEQNRIKSMFANQNLKKMKRMEEDLLKEERLESKRRLEIRWKKMRTHAANLRWVREWVESKIIIPVLEECRRLEEMARMKTALECSADIMDGVVREVEVRHDCGYSPACPGWFCMGMVELDHQHDPPNIPTGRKEDPSTGGEQSVQRTGNSGQEKDNIPNGRTGLKMVIGETIPGGWNLGQKKDNIPNGRTGLKRGREPSEERKNSKNSLYVEQIKNIKLRKSPVKDLIHTFELMARKNLEEHSTKIEDKPADLKTCTQEVKPIIPVGRTEKLPPAKKVWTKLKSGLFGWKLIAQPTKPSKGFKPSTSGKVGTVKMGSQMNKTSETRQIKPPKILFFRGGGRWVQVLVKIGKYTNKGIVFLIKFWRIKVRHLRKTLGVTVGSVGSNNLAGVLVSL